ncbi:hypothetical protein V0R37_07855 [Pollutimonas sp. H1-120]|uniref:hypothetical protein n=1 Tax=Pollutimonas sp. H1-120 TaxID=3148824 RepID=UPI003B5227ED
MKKTDLEKNKALKIVEKMKKGSTPARYSAASGAAPLDRREQRKLDQAKGLVSFPLKLKEEIVQEIRKRAQEQSVDINEVVGSLLEAALASPQASTANK